MPTDASLPDLVAAAGQLVTNHQDASVAFVQRKLGIGHAQARLVMAQLELDGLVTPVTFAGFRLVAPPYRRRLDFSSVTAAQRHARLLRDLALFMTEVHEEGGEGDTRAIAALLHPRPASWRPVRQTALQVLRDRPAAPIFAVASALAALTELAPSSTLTFQAELQAACSEVERPLATLVSSDDLRERSYLRVVRYLEKRAMDGEMPDTQILMWLPHAVPVGASHAFEQASGKGHAEHVVPRRLLAHHCTLMLRDGVPAPQVARWMVPYLAIVNLTSDEANLIDHGFGWETCMPPGWEFDRDSIFARLLQAQIPFQMPGSGVPLHV